MISLKNILASKWKDKTPLSVTCTWHLLSTVLPSHSKSNFLVVVKSLISYVERVYSSPYCLVVQDHHVEAAMSIT
jgi:hypothetical protein